MSNLLADNRTLDRLPLVDFLRAILATTITWHHFALYSPIEPSTTVASEALDGLRNYRWIAQAFFVVGGYVMARAMATRTWNGRQAIGFVGARYIRLGVPYLAAIALAIVASAWARGTLRESLVGAPPTVQQVLAHVVFLQDILGYESLSAGLWFVCIDFQLSLIYVAMLWLRDALSKDSLSSAADRGQCIVMAAAWALALSSLFYFNTSSRWDIWSWHFFAQFFLGVLAFHATQNEASRRRFWCYVAAVAVALVYDWRWRLAVALLTGLLLYYSSLSGLVTRWPRSRVIAYLGRASYSLFLVHYPVLLIVESVWATRHWMTPGDGALALLVAYFASLAVAAIFYEIVERPCAHCIRYRRPGPLHSVTSS